MGEEYEEYDTSQRPPRRPRRNDDEDTEEEDESSSEDDDDDFGGRNYNVNGLLYGNIRADIQNFGNRIIQNLEDISNKLDDRTQTRYIANILNDINENIKRKHNIDGQKLQDVRNEMQTLGVTDTGTISQTVLESIEQNTDTSNVNLRGIIQAIQIGNREIIQQLDDLNNRNQNIYNLLDRRTRGSFGDVINNGPSSSSSSSSSSISSDSSSNRKKPKDLDLKLDEYIGFNEPENINNPIISPLSDDFQSHRSGNSKNPISLSSGNSSSVLSIQEIDNIINNPNTPYGTIGYLTNVLDISNKKGTKEQKIENIRRNLRGRDRNTKIKIKDKLAGATARRNRTHLERAKERVRENLNLPKKNTKRNTRNTRNTKQNTKPKPKRSVISSGSSQEKATSSKRPK